MHRNLNSCRNKYAKIPMKAKIQFLKKVITEQMSIKEVNLVLCRQPQCSASTTLQPRHSSASTSSTCSPMNSPKTMLNPLQMNQWIRAHGNDANTWPLEKITLKLSPLRWNTHHSNLKESRPKRVKLEERGSNVSLKLFLRRPSQKFRS